MFERFTKAARQAVVEAQEEARRLGHDQITPEHVLLGVLAADGDGLAARVLRELGVDRERVAAEIAVLGSGDAEALRAVGVDLEQVRRRVEEAFGPGALSEAPRRRRGFFRRRVLDRIPFSLGAKTGLEQSLRQALALGHSYIGSEHLVLGLLADDDAPTARTLDRLGVSPARVRERIRAELGKAA